jgi:hypothetical protein
MAWCAPCFRRRAPDGVSANLAGRLSGTKRLRSGRDTLEPEAPGSGFGIKSNWLGLVLVAFGGAFLLLLAAAAI